MLLCAHSTQTRKETIKTEEGRGIAHMRFCFVVFRIVTDCSIALLLSERRFGKQARLTGGVSRGDTEELLYIIITDAEERRGTSQTDGVG